jgi:hypothetical protein
VQHYSGPIAPAPASLLSPPQKAIWSGAQNVFKNRCVVCHGCYDAPCQLKLRTFDGIARGASDDKVYDARSRTDSAGCATRSVCVGRKGRLDQLGCWAGRIIGTYMYGGKSSYADPATLSAFRLDKDM